MATICGIFIVWRGEIDELLIFKQQLTGLNSNIKYTFELEPDGRLPVLDVEIMRDGNKLIRSVFRKPIADLSSIPFDAYTPFS